MGDIFMLICQQTPILLLLNFDRNKFIQHFLSSVHNTISPLGKLPSLSCLIICMRECFVLLNVTQRCSQQSFILLSKINLITLLWCPWTYFSTNMFFKINISHRIICTLSHLLHDQVVIASVITHASSFVQTVFHSIYLMGERTAILLKCFWFWCESDWAPDCT